MKNSLLLSISFVLLIAAINCGTNTLYGSSMLSPEDVPAAPTNLVVSSSSPTSLGLTWIDKSSDEDGFRIERSTDGATFTEIGTVDADVTSFISFNLDIFTLYYYRVKAYNSTGDSDPSNIDCALSTQYKIFPIDDAPMIDGDVSEYEHLQPITLTSEGLKGEGKYWITYDETAIYIAGEVADEKLAAVITDPDDWHSYADDGLEVHFDTYHQGGGSLQGDDYKFTVNILNVQCEQNGLSFTWDGPYTTAIAADGTINEADDGDVGYNVEAAMPWSSMAMDGPPAIGDTIGFEFLLNIRTDLGSSTQVWWANTNGDSPNQPDGYGDLIFMSGPESINSNVDVDLINTYPNPVKSVLNIQAKTNGINEYQIEVYNIVGKLMYSSQKAVKLPYIVDMSEMTSGIYLLKVYQAGNEKADVQKIIKQ